MTAHRPIAIVWFRQDLRLHDNPALRAAVDGGFAILPLYILDETDPWRPGGASRWWLHHSLESLQDQFRKKGSDLLTSSGSPEIVLADLAGKSKAAALFWNRCYEPHTIQRDEKIKTRFKSAGLDCRSFNASLLFEPWAIQNKQGNPFQVFTPFYKTCLSSPVPAEPLPEPKKINSPPCTCPPISDLGLLPRHDWAAGLRATWKPGTASARRALADFVDTAVPSYTEARDIPSVSGTSRLSPHLHFGEISPREIWHELAETAASNSTPGLARGAECYLREIVWREFSHHLLFHFPETPTKPLRKEFADFPWEPDERLLKAWQKGVTGIPMVDAGMRELWHTGWMHNRVRMIVASFLVKHLLIPWQDGAAWFWDTLVDADLANNTLGWQWTAGCGADAAPYFRVFNPVTQGMKFDPYGKYVKRWIPELAKLPLSAIHAPWEAPKNVLAEAGVRLGSSYPLPLVGLHEGRDRALAAYQLLRSRKSLL